ncbi:MAG: PIN domain-containing protein [Acidobacteria bacterium]|nr:PIN domain-containing protein [Acidobacteriota bacterium]
MRVFVDANVFLRYFTLDDAGQHERAAALFREASQGAVDLITGPPVLFEVAWTLQAAYGVPRREVLDVLYRILAFPGLALTDAPLAEQALRLARDSNRDFADAYIAASAEAAGADAVATFNRRDLQRLGSALYDF